MHQAALKKSQIFAKIYLFFFPLAENVAIHTAEFLLTHVL